MTDTKLRVFVDPASISTGWAAFRGTQLIEHGSIKVKAASNTAERLGPIFDRYLELFQRLRPDEIHIEQFAGKVHHKCVMSVSTIYAAAWCADVWADQDCSVSSWQAWAKWHGDKLPIKNYETQVDSQDELAAIGIGLWFTKTRID
jgi:Holliday junction resolvasome RuvABC endonuclease subunit